MSAADGSSYAIELNGISKRFGAVQANRDIDLAVRPGHIHGIIGENGAGKSTLMSILYGFYQADSGTIAISGRQVTINNSQEAISYGIGMVHQHFMLVDTFSVLENIVLGAEDGNLLAPSLKKARERLLHLSETYGLAVDPDALVGELPVGIQQRVEILKALYRGAKILILDEPTGVLTPQEADKLFEILAQLKADGVTIMLITHKLREILAITDEVSVMRQGTMVAHRPTAQTDAEELAELMVGRKVLLQVDKGEPSPAREVLRVSGLDVTDSRGVRRVKDVSFTVRAGEIVGIAGVSGNGQSQLLQAIAGILPFQQGSVRINQTDVTPDSLRDAAQMRDLGLSHVPEDRHRMGLVTAFSAQESAILGQHNEACYNGSVLTKPKVIEGYCRDKMETFDIRPPDPALKSANFSGGNQQKLVLAREMMRDGDFSPDLLLVGQPTRGVDIGAIEFIHKQIIAMRDQGKAVLLVSVELDEIMGLADRILVMFDGALIGEVTAAEANERTLGLMMAGSSDGRTTAGEAA